MWSIRLKWWPPFGHGTGPPYNISVIEVAWAGLSMPRGAIAACQGPPLGRCKRPGLQSQAHRGKVAMAFLSQHLVSGEQTKWEKPDPSHTFRGRLDGTRAQADDIVYQDDHVFAFRHRVDPTLPKWWEVHVVIIPKKWIPTVLDFGVGDLELWCKLIEGIQKVALILDLYK